MVNYAEQLSEDIYTPESWAPFAAVLNEAKNAVAANDSLPGEVTDL